MKNRFLGIICLLYVFIIIYVTISNTLKNYLAPQMQKYLLASLVPLLIMGIVLCLNDKIDYKFKVTDLVLILPLIMLIISGDGRLSENFAQNRTSNYKTAAKVESKTEEKEEVIIENKDYDFTNVDFDITDEVYQALAIYLTYDSEAEKIEGKTIRVRGFILKKADYIPNNYFAIGKYGVSCCTADASFMGFFVDYDKTKIKDGKWYEIEGVLKKGKDVAGYTTTVIKAINIKTINSKEEDQYVYPCYSYDNGECNALDKYNEYLN